ncbi:MAG: hypothetical protein OEO82_12070 [Gammaproteobacteria bacterium]|nr:hypothetical protein [Gammaproteobacteria bacterium]
MRYTYSKREFPGSNPLANALVIVAGALVIGVSVVIGFFTFLALSALILVSAAIIGVRIWWLNRKLRAQPQADAVGSQPTKSAGVIEGEFYVVREDSDEA